MISAETERDQKASQAGSTFFKKLNAGQVEALKLIKAAPNFLAYGGAQSGKTALICLAILYRASAFKGSRHITGRKVFKHARQSIWYEGFIPLIEKCPPGLFRPNKSEWYIEGPGNSVIWLAGFDEAQRTEELLSRGCNTLYINEVSEIHDFPFIDKACSRLSFKIEGCTNRFLADENPPEETHWSHQLFIDKINPNTRKALTNPEDYACLLINPDDNEDNLPDGYIKKRLDTLSGNQYKRFRLGQFCSSDAINQLIQSDDIAKAWDPVQSDDIGRALGVDVARYGEDKTVFCMLRGPNIEKKMTWDKTSVPDVIRKTKEIINKYEIPHRCVGIDDTGVGGGVSDGLEEAGYDIFKIIGGAAPLEIDENDFLHPKNVRAQFHWQLRKDIESGNLGNIQDPTLIADLKSLRYDIVGDKQILIWDKQKLKKELGRSPDDADALGYANFARYYYQADDGGIYTQKMFQDDVRKEMEEQHEMQGV
jgi:hypothetical protein